MNFLTNYKGKVFLLLLCIAGISTFYRLNRELLFPVDTKLCGCEKCNAGNHTWFMQYFHRSIKPLLTSDYNLPQEDFNWWKTLQTERRDLTFFKKTTEKIFEIFPGRPPVPEPSSHRCLTCAVVGNSGNLKRSHYGKMIDYHNFVFRMNFGRTKGFEEDVGNRTTHRSMYPESAMNLDNSTHLLLFPFKIRDLEWLVEAFTTGSNAKSYAPIKRKISANKDRVMVVNPAFIKYVHESWLQKKARYPSTGFMTVILALHICDEVSVFGFGADSDGNWSHYWEVLRNKNLRTGPHPGSAEYDMIVELAKQGKIFFYKGW